MLRTSALSLLRNVTPLRAAFSTKAPRIPLSFRHQSPFSKNNSYRRADNDEPPINELQDPAANGNRPNAITMFPGDYQKPGVTIWDVESDIDEDYNDVNMEDDEGFDSDDDDEANLGQDDDEYEYKKKKAKFGDEYDSDDDFENFDDRQEALLTRIERLSDEEAAVRKDRKAFGYLPRNWQSHIDHRGRAYGRGGRKAAAARVWIQPGPGTIVVNRKDVVDYFIRYSDREHLLEPLCVTDTCGKFDVVASVRGGGLTGQAGAIRHGLARALNAYNPDEYRLVLKKLGMLTRDARKVERKKIGLVKARKAPQWVRR